MKNRSPLALPGRDIVNPDFDPQCGQTAVRIEPEPPIMERPVPMQDRLLDVGGLRPASFWFVHQPPYLDMA